MNLLKPILQPIYETLLSNNINESIDIRISNLENFDYQINNLVKFQNHQNIDQIKIQL